VGLQPSPDGQIFPLAFPSSRPTAESTAGDWTRRETCLCHSLKRKSPWAKLFAQGATTTKVEDRSTTC
jgi:hypothetical protein